MSQRFDKTKPLYGSGVLSPEMVLNFNAAMSWNWGPNPPADPDDGWPWVNSSDPTNVKLEIYFAGSWHVILNNLAGPAPTQSSVDRYVHTQVVPALVWTVAHNLNTEDLNITLWNAAKEVIGAQSIVPSDPDTLVITFNTPVAGKAIVLG